MKKWHNVHIPRINLGFLGFELSPYILPCLLYTRASYIVLPIKTWLLLFINPLLSKLKSCTFSNCHLCSLWKKDSLKIGTSKLIIWRESMSALSPTTRLLNNALHVQCLFFCIYGMRLNTQHSVAKLFILWCIYNNNLERAKAWKSKGADCTLANKHLPHAYI